MHTKIVRILVSVSAAFSLLASPVLGIAADGGNGGHGHVLPKNAVKITDELYDLGYTIDASGDVVRGYAFVHHANGNNSHKPQHNNGGGDVITSSCYAFISKGFRWKNTEDYRVDSANNASLDTATVKNLLATSLNTWDSQVAYEVFGNEVPGTVDVANIGVISNNANEVAFANIDSLNVIAVTYVWGIFWGSPSQRKITEWDMVFDDADFAWSFTGEAGKMDFQNIATHEIGHAAGMGHPSDSCTEETMYRFGANGETKKRDLNTGDIAGIKALYK